MSSNILIMSVVGARPNFIKIATLAQRISMIKDVEHILVHTGQHYDENMSDEFFRDLVIPHPDLNLGVGSDSHAAQTAKIMLKLEPLLLEHKPDWVVVVGDVNSTMAAALVAVKLGIKVAHVEAGLRSFDRSMPEEINRIVTDSVAELLLTHCPDADQNLLNEGIAKDKIIRTGNIMIDTLVMNLARIEKQDGCKKLKVTPGGYAYVTLHRPSNVDREEKLASIVDELLRLGRQIPVVFPVHPRTRSRLMQYGLFNRLAEGNGIKLMEPIGYIESMGLLKNAYMVLTDSGGIQEETTYLGVPCLTLRENTERPITITQGTNRLTSVDRMARDIDDTISGKHPPKTATIPDLWDGKTSERIINALLERTDINKT
jgi:UDP-N-acetylglucosamine 2-epimerase (non-hydrolysing)